MQTTISAYDMESDYHTASAAFENFFLKCNIDAVIVSIFFNSNNLH